MKKINKLSDYSGEDNFTSVFLKINEIIDVINNLALSDKEEKKYPPIEELLKKGYIGGELEAILKEDLEYILETYYSGTRSMDNARNGILKLFQSHLLKKIKEASKVWFNEYAYEGAYIREDDIIKIINNITK